ncbi:hypothetical protein D3C77_744630 [compost metagenome]
MRMNRVHPLMRNLQEVFPIIEKINDLFMTLVMTSLNDNPIGAAIYKTLGSLSSIMHRMDLNSCQHLSFRNVRCYDER